MDVVALTIANSMDRNNSVELLCQLDISEIDGQTHDSMEFATC